MQGRNKFQRTLKELLYACPRVITPSTFHWTELSHMVPPNCKGSWEVQQSRVTRGQGKELVSTLGILGHSLLRSVLLFLLLDVARLVSDCREQNTKPWATGHAADWPRK